MDFKKYDDGRVVYDFEGHHYDFNLKEHLSEHFTLGEMINSSWAEKHDIINLPQQPYIIDNLRRLVVRVLEPLRQYLNKEVIINSGYRTYCLNFSVHGEDDSQHLWGEAADIACESQEDARRKYEFLRDNVSYDQLLLEHRSNAGHWWVHVSYTMRRALRFDHQEINLSYRL